MKIKNILLFLLFSIITGYLSCVSNISNLPDTVLIQNFAFNPQSITINSGQTVTWQNKDSVTHTVTETGSAFDSGNILSGGTYSRKFDTTGTFHYKCSIHIGMTGTVVVQ